MSDTLSAGHTVNAQRMSAIMTMTQYWSSRLPWHPESHLTIPGATAYILYVRKWSPRQVGQTRTGQEVTKRPDSCLPAQGPLPMTLPSHPGPLSPICTDQVISKGPCCLLNLDCTCQGPCRKEGPLPESSMGPTGCWFLCVWRLHSATSFSLLTSPPL